VVLKEREQKVTSLTTTGVRGTETDGLKDDKAFLQPIILFSLGKKPRTGPPTPTLIPIFFEKIYIYLGAAETKNPHDSTIPQINLSRQMNLEQDSPKWK
jgi:hypothetical protein